MALQAGSPSQAAARKQQHPSSPTRMSVRQRRELELATEQQKQDIIRWGMLDIISLRLFPATSCSWENLLTSMIWHHNRLCSPLPSMRSHCQGSLQISRGSRTSAHMLPGQFERYSINLHARSSA